MWISSTELPLFFVLQLVSASRESPRNIIVREERESWDTSALASLLAGLL